MMALDLTRWMRVTPEKTKIASEIPVLRELCRWRDRVALQVSFKKFPATPAGVRALRDGGNPENTLSAPSLPGHSQHFRARPWHWWAGGITFLVVATLVFLIVFFDWNWFKHPLERILSRDSGRTVRIEGNLNVHLFAWEPSATVDGLLVSNPPWAPPGNTAQIKRLSVQTSLLSLLIGSPELLRVDLEDPQLDFFRDRQGRATWEFGKTAAVNAQPPDLPPIRQFMIRNGHLHLVDLQRRMVLTGTISSRETGQGNASAFQLDGQGTMNAKPFQMHVQGGPLLHIDRATPYNFDLQVAAGATRVIAKGAVTHPFNLRKFSAAVTFAGPNLADLYYLTGLALPGTPPYRVSALLSRDGARTSLAGLSGTVGRTDVHGSAAVDRSSGRPYVTADITSRALYFTDLGPLFGSRAPAAATHAAAIKAHVSVGASNAEARQQNDASHLLPDTPLPVDRVRQMDADITFHADKVISTDFPLRHLDLKLKLDHGVLSADPVSMALAVGKLAGKIRIDARNAVPETDIDARLQGVNLQQFVTATDTRLQGTMEARAKLHGRGNSVHLVAASASGAVTAVVPHGLVGNHFAELLGIDVDRAFLFNASGDTTMRCAIADFQAHDGTLTVRNLLFDSDVVKATGTGTVNLGDETLALEIKGEPKKFTMFRIRAPIEVAGPWRHPHVGLKYGAVAAQVGASIALGVLATPIAAILPFVDPGLAKNADCAAVVAGAQQRGAPKPALRAKMHGK
jgi:uncharacterized protein involved in outer membrane biogenesis